MAKYFLHVKTFSRGQGSSVTKAAAYRAGERIRDERSGAVHDYSDRTDVAHAEIVLPDHLEHSADMEWARDRSVLWNAVQGSGRRCNTRLGRQVLVLLPIELSPGQRVALVRGFSRDLANRFNNVVDFAVHEPRVHADERHHHAHLLMTTRQVGPDGLGARTSMDLSGTERHARGLGPSKDDLLWLRERWAERANEALLAAGSAARIDARSYRAQGIDVEPQPYLPPKIVYAERLAGHALPQGDAIRARHRERVEARALGGDALARVVERQRREGREGALRSATERSAATGGAEKRIRTGAMTREQFNAQRRAYCKANSAEILRKQTERRRANRDEVNRKQREDRQKRTAQKEKDRLRAAIEAGATVKRPTVPPLDAMTRGSPGPERSAEDAVKRWLHYREEQQRVPDASRDAQEAGVKTRKVRGARAKVNLRDDLSL